MASRVRVEPESELGDALRRIDLETDLAEHDVALVDEDHIDPDAGDGLFARAADPAGSELDTRITRDRVPPGDRLVVPCSRENGRIGDVPRSEMNVVEGIERRTDLGDRRRWLRDCRRLVASKRA